MKKILVLMLMTCVIAGTADAQRRAKRHQKTVAAVAQAPDMVQQAFQQKFFNAQHASWHKMASGNWYADFQQDTLAAKAEFTPEGQWVATRAGIALSQLPDTIAQAVQQQYVGAVITQVTRIDRADVASYYKMELDISGTTKELLANDSGTLIE